MASLGEEHGLSRAGSGAVPCGFHCPVVGAIFPYLGSSLYSLH